MTHTCLKASAAWLGSALFHLQTLVQSKGQLQGETRQLSAQHTTQMALRNRSCRTPAPLGSGIGNLGATDDAHQAEGATRFGTSVRAHV